MQTRPDERFWELSQLCFEQELTAAEQSELETYLLDSPECRQAFTDYSLMMGDLVWWRNQVAEGLVDSHDDLPILQPSRPRPVAEPRTRSTQQVGWGVKLFYSLTLLMASVLAGFGVFQFLTPGEHATVVAVAGSEDLLINQAFPPGTRIQSQAVYELSEGFLHIQMDRGAQLVLTGQAQFQVLNEMTFELLRGQVSVEVPATASGFTILTPTGEVVDYGTRFSVEVTKDLQTEVHVAEGKVSFSGRKAPVELLSWLKAGESAMVHTDDSATKEISHNRFAYYSPEIVAEINTQHGNPEFQRWLAFSQQLRNDPDLLVYFPFDKQIGENSRINSQALASPLGLIRAELHGPIVTEGRWPEKAGVTLAGPGSGQYVSLSPQDSQRMNFESPFSVALWFKTDSVTQPHQPLMCHGDDSWRLQFFEHTEKGLLSFVVDPKVPRPDEIGFAKTSTRANDGHWHHAVAIYNPLESLPRCTIYLDGKLEHASSCEPLVPTELPIWIGSNSQATSRFFRGQIDEVAIFARDLTESEIEHMYQSGRPTQ